MKKNVLKMSIVASMLLSSGAYAGKIVTDTDLGWEPFKQYGFGGWNLENVLVKIVSTNDYSTALPETDFNETTGVYTPMEAGMSFESEIWSGEEIRGLLHGKDWPVGEPAGIKIINGDTQTNNGKPENCIINTSYIGDDLNDGVTHYVDDADPIPVICSSPFQTHKRFKVNMQPTTVFAYDELSRYGKPVELVFNLEEGDTSSLRYQVFQKINNYTGMRLDGYKIEVIKADGSADDNLTLSIGLQENDTKDPVEDIWDVEDMANFSHGLWGPADQHFPTDGFFDSKRAGFIVDQEGHNTPTLEGGPTTLGSNYEALFGIWLPSKWQPLGIFFDDDNDPLTDAELVAFWGTVPDAPIGTMPAWHKGKDYDLSDGDQSWAEPSMEELITWYADPLYSVGHIEDTLNLGLNYIVNVGNNENIGGKFTVRITPRVAVDQTPPNYIDAQGDYIMPPTDYNGTDVVLIISPSPEFIVGANLSVGLADTTLNTASDVNETYDITLTASNGDEETLTLTETDVNSSVFIGTIGTDSDAVSVQGGTVNVTNGTVVTVTYNTLTATTTATDEDGTPVINPSSGGGGGCTYNPNSKSFDLTFLMLMALGSLYAFRRRFSK